MLTAAEASRTGTALADRAFARGVVDPRTRLETLPVVTDFAARGRVLAGQARKSWQIAPFIRAAKVPTKATIPRTTAHPTRA